jgi:hypothetical protein
MRSTCQARGMRRTLTRSASEGSHRRDGHAGAMRGAMLSRPKLRGSSSLRLPPRKHVADQATACFRGGNQWAPRLMFRPRKHGTRGTGLALASGWHLLELRREMPESTRLPDDPQTPNRVAPLEHLDDRFDDVVDVALGMNGSMMVFTPRPPALSPMRKREMASPGSPARRSCGRGS